MLRLVFLIILLKCACSLFGQTAAGDLSKIKTVKQAKKYIEENPKANGKIFTIESVTDTSEILLPLYNKSRGTTFQIDNHNYRVLAVDSVLSFRVSYIFLSGEQLTKVQIDSLRQKIISTYKNGTSFFELAQQYGMDGNITGDTRWFTENVMVKAFEEAVRNHKKGEIFTVDIPEQNWYHVVLKTFDDTYIKKLTILKTISSQQ